ncbi:GreA/GreB family elongation factor [Bradyrhizobium sp. 195]|uniref:GreA/GreB family elongation factor n=1 Tax=Bradyrhizobium sp. 195 TaxID=2782662 RepID=UPI002000E7C4|nr:GreA/GreB family elongation factor [Bradyrhizobium sp. 195]
MGSQVRYCDDTTGEVRDVVLVYPHEADITLKRISVLPPIGAALIGLRLAKARKEASPGRSRLQGRIARPSLFCPTGTM